MGKPTSPAVLVVTVVALSVAAVAHLWKPSAEHLPTAEAASTAPSAEPDTIQPPREVATELPKAEGKPRNIVTAELYKLSVAERAKVFEACLKHGECPHPDGVSVITDAADTKQELARLKAAQAAYEKEHGAWLAKKAAERRAREEAAR